MGHQKSPSSLDATNEAQNGTTSAFSHLSFAEVLEDLSSRFIVNLPAEELASIERICFQVEQAHWFYEDFLRPLNPSLTSFSLRRFSSYLLHTSALTVPLIQRYISTSSSGKQKQQDLEAAFDEFMKYKTRVPVCGVVMLNSTLDKCVLVKGWKSSAAWGFPKGKINQQESERDCAVREVLEETGFDCDPLLESASSDFMELTMREQKIRLYIVPGVDESTQFETLTRKEISRIAWFKLSDLPTWKKNRVPPQGMGGKFYLISPFIGKLKQWIQENKHRKVGVVTALAADPSSVQTAEVKVADEVRSDDLKALLGLSQDQSIGPPASKGVQMIQEQGDARGRQLLDLLRGDSTSVGMEERRDQSVIMDERERGTAALLAALNAGAGKVSEVPASSSQSSSATLLSMLNGSQPLSATTDSVATSSISTMIPPPLAAPRAHNTSQAQSLLNLISPGDAATTAPDMTLKDQERARQRDALLNNLMAPSTLYNVAPEPPAHNQDGVDEFRSPRAAPPPPPPAFTNSLLQPIVNQSALQHLPSAPSPFSTFVQQQATQANMPPTLEEQNPLLALLNGKSSGTAPTPHQMHQQVPIASPPPPPQFLNFSPPPFHSQGQPAHPPPPAHLQHFAMAPPPHHLQRPPPSGPYGQY